MTSLCSFICLLHSCIIFLISDKYSSVDNKLITLLGSLLLLFNSSLLECNLSSKAFKYVDNELIFSLECLFKLSFDSIICNLDNIRSQLSIYFLDNSSINFVSATKDSSKYSSNCFLNSASIVFF